MKLKACPACGGDTGVTAWDRSGVWVQCDDYHCRMRGPVVIQTRADFDDEVMELACQFWNDLPRREPL